MEEKKIEKITIHFVGREELEFSTTKPMQEVVEQIARNAGITSFLDAKTKEVYSINTRNITYIEKTIEKKKKEFIPPTRQEVYEYAQEQNNLELADKFYDWYNSTNWRDKNNKRIKNWKNKFLIWIRRNDEKQKQVADNTKMVADGVCKI